jgi:hypothetical protein
MLLKKSVIIRSAATKQSSCYVPRKRHFARVFIICYILFISHTIIQTRYREAAMLVEYVDIFLLLLLLLQLAIGKT